MVDMFKLLLKHLTASLIKCIRDKFESSYVFDVREKS